MNIFLKIPDEELGRFLLAYYRGVFPPTFKLGKAFLFYYGLAGYIWIAKEQDDKKALELIQEEFIGRLD
jgi:hypothetical protein